MTQIVLAEGCWNTAPQAWRPLWKEAAIIGDRTVMELFGDQIKEIIRPLVERLHMLSFPPGETSKTRETKIDLEDRLLSAGFPRTGVIVAVGGGVSLDLAGFVASTYMRGVDAVYFPTTLLAQVDAAIGGKTGVNTPAGKNLVGSFHQPVNIFIDPACLGSLSRIDWRNGLAEMIKTAVIADGRLFEWIDEHSELLKRPGMPDLHPIRRCVDIKSEIVGQDMHERGRRAVLNFGHSIGHAIEAASEYGIPHGEAVGIGMVVEAMMAEKLCGFPPDSRERFTHLLTKLGFDLHVPYALETIFPFLRVDKKNRGDRLRMALPTRFGEMACRDGEWTVSVPFDVLEDIWPRL
ncbi:MAG: 3-dehydroquinate synthase [Myxococcales bacterium]|nr:MAG: 3-dehydroquinate synthase [Myxococcales bacterium]